MGKHLGAAYIAHEKAMRSVEDYKRNFAAVGQIASEEDIEKMYNMIIAQELNKYKTFVLPVELEMEMERKKQMALLTHDLKGWWYITIRPDEKVWDFDMFYTAFEKYIRRKCVKDYFYSYEQKGLSLEDLGRGFHVHFCGEIDLGGDKKTKDSIKGAFPNVIYECTPCKTKVSKMNIFNYIKNYEVEDGHKAQMKDWDLLWRTNRGLKDIYYPVGNEGAGLSS
jgi:hypothetical protein